MASSLQPKYQIFQLDTLSASVRVKEPVGGEPFVLLEDIRDALCQVVSAFELNGEPVPFLENKNHDPLFQQRIAYYPGQTLTVVPLPKGNHDLVQDAVVDLLPRRPWTAPEAAPNTAMARTGSRGSPSLMPASFMALDHRRGRPSSVVSVENGSPSYIYTSVTPIEDILDVHHDRLHAETQELMAQVLASRLTAERQAEEIHELRKTMLEMEERNLQLQKHAMEKQQEALDRLVQIQSGIQTVLTQTFELHEYSSPRLFIVLPEMAYDGLNPTLLFNSWTHVQFRLYFLCECGESHTNPIGPHGLNHIHLARHEGYAINRPKEFFRKYGPTVLRLLHLLKYGLAIGGMVVPMLSAVHAVDLPESLVKDLSAKVTTSIGYLTTYQGTLDQDAPVRDSRQSEGASGDGQISVVPTSVFSESKASSSDPVDDDRNGDGVSGVVDKLVQMEGADLRRLTAFLERKDHDRTLGNLYRTVDKEGHVKWICQDHFRSTFHLRQDRQFETEIALLQGSFDQTLGKVSVYLSSSSTEATESFLNTLSRSNAFSELDLQFRKYSFPILEQLARALLKTSVSKLILTGHTFVEHFPSFRKKLYPILSMMNSGKIQSLHLKAMKDVFPQRIEMPKAGGLPFIRSLELTEISLADGEVFKSLLLACSHISVLGLTNVPLSTAETLSQFLKGITACQRVRSLTLRDCSFPPERALHLVTVLKSLESLKELDFGLNWIGDENVCEIVEAVGGRLEKLWLPQTGFGDESAMALERAILPNAKRLRNLDVSDHMVELSAVGMESFVRLIGRLECVELVLPRAQSPSDKMFATLIRRLNVRSLERLQLEGSDCGDLTALSLTEVLSTDPDGPFSLTRFKLAFSNATMEGALALCKALSRTGKSAAPYEVAELSFAGSQSLFVPGADPAVLMAFFKSAFATLSVLSLHGTLMRDEHAAVFERSVQDLELSFSPTTTPSFRLESLDVSFNQMTPLGAGLILKSLTSPITTATLRTLRLESRSFSVMGAMGPAVQQFLETNHSLARLTTSHVNLKELTAGLLGNQQGLKAIEVHFVDGPDAEDILSFGEFLGSERNGLLRLVIKHAQVCEDARSLDYLKDCLEKNKTIVSLDWDYDQGLKVDPYPLGHFLLRNRELWSKRLPSGGKMKGDDLVQAGVEPYLLSHIGRFRGS
ncbi:hypothetical protein EMPS_06645 [Entomortierella parvispora]|uniref:Uncharacterized protein n=1 Tax=Entomortierella parvispora TaxID=205924 RepID=A0A9P3LXN6_9FUNG|nr:hypothetical protein EMPS_06645 [Entomortierella parvispora]